MFRTASILFRSFFIASLLLTVQAHAWDRSYYTKRVSYYPSYPQYNQYSYYRQPYTYAPSMPTQTWQPVRRQPVEQSATVQAETIQPVSKQQPVNKPLEKIKANRSEVQNKVQSFVDDLLPIINQENQRILVDRVWIQQLDGCLSRGEIIDDDSANKLKKITRRYRIDGDVISDPEVRSSLLSRVDMIPASLALAQAANESAWGESRFAKEASNLFGIWTYDEDKGLVPKNREEGKKHFVRVFDDFDASVGYYMHLLNTHSAYQPLRDLRAELRSKNQSISGHELAAGLEKYSAKGLKYIKLIQQIITQNNWASLDTGSRQG